MYKLFIVTRSDLPPGARAAQSVHAALAFAHEHPQIETYWFKNSNNLVILEAPDEEALDRLTLRAEQEGIPYVDFHEPDFNDALTAIALGPTAWRIVSSLPLALKPPKAPQASSEVPMVV